MFLLHFATKNQIFVIKIVCVKTAIYMYVLANSSHTLDSTYWLRGTASNVTAAIIFTDKIGDLLTVNDVGWNLKIINKYKLQQLIK